MPLDRVVAEVGLVVGRQVDVQDDAGREDRLLAGRLPLPAGDDPAGQLGAKDGLCLRQIGLDGVL